MRRGVERGAVMTVPQCWELTRRWYPGRLELDWQRLSAERMAATFAEVGLTGPFWSLHG